MKKHWNYRILRFYAEMHDEEYFQIHEVHYEDDKPVSYGEPAAIVLGNSYDELGDVLTRMEIALEKPILDTENWPNEYEV